MNTDTTEDVFVVQLREEMQQNRQENPNLTAFVWNELGLTNITDQDFLSPEGRDVVGYNFDRVRGNPCLQQQKVFTQVDEQRLFAEAFKYL